MAITVTSNPDDIVPAYRPILFKAESDDANIAGMFADVYVDGVYESTLEASPNLDTSNEFTFDAQSIMQAVLDIDLSDSISGNDIRQATNSHKTCQLKLFEIIDSGDTFTTTWDEDGAGTGSTSTGTSQVMQVSIQHTETFSDFIDNKFLTNTPRRKILSDQPFQLDAIVDNPSNFPIHGVVKEFDSNGSVLNTDRQILSGDDQEVKVIVEVDPNTFNASTSYIEVKIQSEPTPSNFSDLTETLTFDLHDKCTDTVILTWQNALGGFDYYFFSARKAKKLTGEASLYEVSLTEGFAVTDRGFKVASVKSDEEIEITTEAISRDTVKWIGEIVQNPNHVYMIDGSNYVPMLITSGSIEVEDTEDGKYEATISISPANKHIAQIG